MQTDAQIDALARSLARPRSASLLAHLVEILFALSLSLSLSPEFAFLILIASSALVRQQRTPKADFLAKNTAAFNSKKVPSFVAGGRPTTS